MLTKEPTQAGDVVENCDSSKPLQIVCFSICLLFLVGFALFRWGDLEGSFSKDFDEGVYLCSARNVVHGSPLFQSVFCSQPPAFVATLALAFQTFGEGVEVGRAVVLFYAIICLASIAWISWRLSGPLAAPVAMFGMGLPGCFFLNSCTCQAEIPSLALTLLAIATLLTPSKTFFRLRIILGAVFFSLGVLNKLLVVPMLLSTCVLLLLAPESLGSKNWAFLSAKEPLRYALGGPLALFGVSSLVLVAIILSPYQLPTVYEQTVVFHQAASKAFPHDFLHNAFIITKTLFDAAGLSSLALIGFWFLWRRNRLACVWLLLWLAASGSFLMLHSPLWERHSMVLLPPLAAAAGAAVLPLYKGRLAMAWPCLLAFGSFSFNLSTGSYGLAITRIWNQPAPAFSDDQEAVINLIRQRTTPRDWIITDEQMQAFRAERMVPPALCDTSLVRIQSGYLQTSEAIQAARNARMVIFWTHRLENLPGFENWVRSHFELIKESDDKKIFLRN